MNTKTTAKKAAVKTTARVVVKKPAKKVVKAAWLPAGLVEARNRRLARIADERATVVETHAVLEAHFIATNAMMTMHKEQPALKGLIGKNLFLRDSFTGKYNVYGQIELVLTMMGCQSGQIVNLYGVWCHDVLIPLHAIRKEGAKLVANTKLVLPNKANTVLVPYATPAAKRTLNSVAPVADEPKLKLTVVEGELAAKEFAKGTAIIVDPAIKGDKVARVKLEVSGKGTPRSPFVKRRVVYTEKGQKVVAAQVRMSRGKLKALAA